MRLLVAGALPCAGASASDRDVGDARVCRDAGVRTFAGREAGSTGERLAGDYIAAQLARIGARPLPGRSDMFMPFEFTAGSRDGGSPSSCGPDRGAPPFTGPSDVQALSFSDDAR